MKKIIIFILLLVIIIPISLWSQSYISLDIKTPFIEKFELKLLKKGLIISIHRYEKYKVQEFGENYSVWLTDLYKRESENITYYSVFLQICEPSVFFRKEILSETIKFTINRKIIDSVMNGKTEFEEANIQEEIKSLSNNMPEVTLESIDIGDYEIIFNIMIDLYNYIKTELKRKLTPLELAEIGYGGFILYKNMDRMIEEITQK